MTSHHSFNTRRTRRPPLHPRSQVSSHFSLFVTHSRVSFAHSFQLEFELSSVNALLNGEIRNDVRLVDMDLTAIGNRERLVVALGCQKSPDNDDFYPKW